jgi:hypothetical protein
LGNAVRQLWADQATANAERDEVGLVAETLDELRGTSEQRLRVEVYDRGLLGPDLTLRIRHADLTQALTSTRPAVTVPNLRWVQTGRKRRSGSFVRARVITIR